MLALRLGMKLHLTDMKPSRDSSKTLFLHNVPAGQTTHVVRIGASIPEAMVFENCREVLSCRACHLAGVQSLETSDSCSDTQNASQNAASQQSNSLLQPVPEPRREAPFQISKLQLVHRFGAQIPLIAGIVRREIPKHYVDIAHSRMPNASELQLHVFQNRCI